jgi:hypothetical protein
MLKYSNISDKELSPKEKMSIIIELIIQKNKNTRLRIRILIILSTKLDKKIKLNLIN